MPFPEDIIRNMTLPNMNLLELSFFAELVTHTWMDEDAGSHTNRVLCG